MAPSRTPGRNKREPDYSKIGVEGRKTGVTLKDTGIRDEHGLEPIDGIFSSPEKSPVKRNGTAHDASIEEEEDMDIGQSTIPEPTEVLSARRNGKPILPPPHARSPIKTSLNSSPRRSVGPLSSPIRQSNNATPSRAASHPLIGRRLEFSGGSRKSTEHSPRLARSTVSPSPAVKSSKLGRPVGKNKKRVFDLSLDDDDVEEEEAEGQSGKDTANINSKESSRHVEEDFHPYEDSAPNIDEDESLHINGNVMLEGDEQTQLTAESLPEETQPQIKAKRGRPPKHAEAKSVQDESSRLDDDPASSARAVKRAGRPRKSAATEEGNSLVDPQIDQPKSKRGRKPKGEVFQDDIEEAETGSVKGPKRPRIDPTEGTSVETNVKGAKSKAKKPPPSERDPNAKIVAAKKKAKAPSVEPAGRFSRPRSRGLTILRTGTPAEDDGARVLKTGRTSVKPIAYWRNERIVYGELNMDGKDLVLPAIKEVIRTDEIIEPRPKHSYRRRGATGRPRSHALEEVEEEDEDQEEWEADPGFLHTEVLRWDPETERGLEEVHEEVDLALAPVALEGLTREVKGAEFMYAKTITLPFFHSGMVDIPPGGEKKTKNSRKNHMVFWVFSGRVQVKVADTSFSIGRGGMWQVPRGNLYSIANVYTRPSRIFFAQGCFMTPEDVEEEAVPATAE